jgi:hypothetical protein
MTSAEVSAAPGAINAPIPERGTACGKSSKAAGHPAGQLPMAELLPGLAPQELSVPWLVTAAEVRCMR